VAYSFSPPKVFFTGAYSALVFFFFYDIEEREETASIDYLSKLLFSGCAR